MALSVFSAAEQLTSPQAAPELSVGALVARVQTQLPGLEQLRRSPSGQITAYWFENGTPGAAVIDPARGAAEASVDSNPVERWLIGLHRQLFAGDMGRLVTAAGARLMLMLCLSRASLMARRMGGWRNWFGHAHGTGAGRLHI